MFMAKVHFDKKEIAEILSNYNLGGYKSHEYFTAGCVQTNIKVWTTKGIYALRIYTTRTISYVKYEFNVLNYLSKRKYPTPLPIRNIHGKFISKYGKYPIGIFSFIKGKHINKLNNITCINYLCRKDLYVQKINKILKIYPVNRFDFY